MQKAAADPGKRPTSQHMESQGGRPKSKPNSKRSVLTIRGTKHRISLPPWKTRETHVSLPKTFPHLRKCVGLKRGREGVLGHTAHNVSLWNMVTKHWILLR